MKYFLIKSDYIQFKSELNDLQNFELNFEKKTQSGLEKLKTFYKEWENNVEKILVENISPNPELLIDIFKRSNSTLFDRIKYGKSKGIEDEIKTIEREFTYQKSNLNKVVDYISITDNFVGQENKTITEIQEKIDFILEKLKVLFNDNFYSINTILTLNSIEHRNDEPEEISEILHKRGYIIKKEKYLPSDEVKISIKGASYIERKNKTNSKKKSNTNLNSKIDKIIEKLNELGFGQEVIFNELEELRNLQTKLPKKTWGQLLKGKLLDLALSEIISKETATYIYENLTNDHFKLLK